jgi:hypothetical protein
MWGHADSAYPDQNLDPLNYGWKAENDHYAIDWYSGPSIPEYLFDEEDVHERVDDGTNDQPDFITDCDDFVDVNSEKPWSDDSESDTEV